MTNALTLKEVDGIAVITFDMPQSKVNTLSSKYIPEFDEILHKVESSSHLTGVVIISGKDDCFIAGADITELQSATREDQIKNLSEAGQKFYDRLETFPKPVVAAIHGACLGGGLELALACHYRIATLSPKTVLGLPEVLLGLIPGAGGTQRLPALIGLEKALPMMLAGSSIKPEKALKMGLVDYCVYPNGLYDIALQAAKRLVNKTLKIKREIKSSAAAGMLEKTQMGRDFIFKKAHDSVQKKTRGLYPAPFALLDAVAHGLKYGKKAGFKKETEEFARLSQTSEAKGLMSLYFGQTELKKNRFGDPLKKVQEIGILGAGLMGAGIALVSLEKKMNVRLKDINQESLNRGKKYIWQGFNEKIKRKSLTKFEVDQYMSRLNLATDGKGFSKCSLVVEAVFEDLNLKHRVLKEIEALTSEDCVFASNTSALPIKDIAKASQRPHQVIGMHYFSPVQKMPLLEVIVTELTSKEASARALDVGIRQGKTVIVVKDGPGFYTTRILAPFMDEAALLCLEGQNFHEINHTMQDFGFPVGPITLMDEVGLDVAYHIAHDLSLAFPGRVGLANPKSLAELIEKKMLGRKTGNGFFVYEKPQNSLANKLFSFSKSKEKPINPEALAIMKRYATKPADHVIPQDEVQKRMIYRMINEAAYCLQDGILARPLDGDIGAVFGLGFPPFTGGPFRYIDRVGINEILDDMKKLTEVFGERFAPCQLLKDYGLGGKKFY